MDSVCEILFLHRDASDGVFGVDDFGHEVGVVHIAEALVSGPGSLEHQEVVAG